MRGVEQIFSTAGLLRASNKLMTIVYPQRACPWGPHMGFEKPRSPHGGSANRRCHADSRPVPTAHHPRRFPHSPGVASAHTWQASCLLSSVSYASPQALVYRPLPLAPGATEWAQTSTTSVPRSGSRKPTVQVRSGPGSQAGPFPASASFPCRRQPGLARTSLQHLSIFMWPSLPAWLCVYVHGPSPFKDRLTQKELVSPAGLRDLFLHEGMFTSSKDYQGSAQTVLFGGHSPSLNRPLLSKKSHIRAVAEADDTLKGFCRASAGRVTGADGSC